MKKIASSLAAVLLSCCLLVAPGCSRLVQQPEEPSVEITTAPVDTIEPIKMLGQWELAWTEGEGDRNEAEPGTGCIFIFFEQSESDADYPCG